LKKSLKKKFKTRNKFNIYKNDNYTELLSKNKRLIE